MSRKTWVLILICAMVISSFKDVQIMGAQDTAGVSTSNAEDNKVLIERWVFSKVTTGSSVCTHNLEFYEKKEPTCTEKGNEEYWHCTKCDGYFRDMEGKIQYEENAWIKDATGHDLEHHEEKEASCTEDGNEEYWHCTKCNGYFRDMEGEIQYEENAWIKDATGHDLEHHEEKEASCTEDGNEEYWHCTKCDGYFRDKEGEIQYDENAWIKDATGHDLEHHEEKEASCTEDGNEEYWHCTKCDGYFRDKEGEIQYDENAWIKESNPEAHAWGEWETKVEATEKKNGESICVCKNNPEHVQKRVIPKKLLTVTWGKKTSLLKLVGADNLDVEIPNQAEYKYISWDDENKEITVKKNYKGKINDVPVWINKYKRKINVHIPAPKIKIKKKHLSGKITKYIFKYNVKGATKIKVRMKKGGTSSINKQFNKYVSKPKSNKDSYMLYSYETMKKLKNKITFVITAYYGKNKSETKIITK